MTNSATERAYRAVLAGWGDPTEETTWAEMVDELSLLAEEYGEDLPTLIAERGATR
jgi:hypothetical protein